MDVDLCNCDNCKYSTDEYIENTPVMSRVCIGCIGDDPNPDKWTYDLWEPTEEEEDA